MPPGSFSRDPVHCSSLHGKMSDLHLGKKLVAAALTSTHKKSPV